jgi:hypothetical protein
MKAKVLCIIALVQILSGCNTPAQPSASMNAVAGSCEFTPGEIVDGLMPGLVIGATVLTRRGAQQGYGVHVRFNGEIGLVASFEDTIKNYPHAAMLDCRGVAVLSPGFVNAHEHPAYSWALPDVNLAPRYTHRDEWRQGLNGKVELPSPNPYYFNRDDNEGTAKLVWMELRHLLGGATTIAGSGGVPGFARNVGLQSRAGDLEIYDFEADMSTFPFSYSAYTELQPQCDGGAKMSFSPRDDSNLKTIAYVPHIGEGSGSDCAAREEVKRYLGWVEDHEGRRFSMIHGVATSRAEFEILREKDVTLVWSPRSNLALYGETIDVASALDKNVRLALSTDWSPSGSFTMREELACAEKVLSSVNQEIDYRDLWTMATRNGAYALGLEDSIGEIAQGYLADLVMVRADSSDPYRDVIKATHEKVLAVWVGGTPVLLAPDVGAPSPVNCLNIMGVQPGLCAPLASLDIDTATLQRYTGDSVPLVDTSLQAPCEL